MQEIYLDNSATTCLSESAKKRMLEAMEKYGNPSSLHSKGVEAGGLLDEARKSLMYALGITKNDGELIFTSCGSEASETAIMGSVYAKERRVGKRIVSTNSEHPSVENNLRALEKRGFEVIRIPTVGGVLDMDAVDKALNSETFLVTMMQVNNETGAVYDVKKVFEEAKRRSPSVITHCDAVQGFMKLKCSYSKIGADLVTVSGHKIHGPKGVGALFINKELIKQRAVTPLILGGGQEKGFRSGTENVIGISGFGGAAREAFSSLDRNIAHMSLLREKAIERLSTLDIKFNIPKEKFAPHILNITLPSVKSETMLHFLSAEGIFVSSGSACSSHAKTPSASLIGFGLTPFEADCSLRISFSEYNTEEDVSALAEALRKGLDRLVRIKR